MYFKKKSCSPQIIVNNVNILTYNKDISDICDMNFANVGTNLIDDSDDKGNDDNSYVASCMSK